MRARKHPIAIGPPSDSASRHPCGVLELFRCGQGPFVEIAPFGQVIFAPRAWRPAGRPGDQEPHSTHRSTLLYRFLVTASFDLDIGHYTIWYGPSASHRSLAFLNPGQLVFAP